MKNGEIILCKGIKMDKNYDNTLSYSENNMVTLCRNNKIAESTKYSILDPIKGEMDVALPYASCIYANYIAFRNPNVGNKWYFAFVNDVEYVNPATTKIHYQVDVFSTWYSKFNVGQAFIEREHVSDDTIGANTVPEGLETGEFVINDTGTVLNYEDLYVSYVYIGVSKVAYGLPGASTYYGGDYGNLYSGVTYYMFKSTNEAGKFLRAYDLIGYGDNIISVFMLPKKIYNPTSESVETWNISRESGSTAYSVNGYTVPHNNLPYALGTATININSQIDGYTPKNNKLFTSEFNYLYITNNAGTDVKYNYEDFNENTPTFKAEGVICVGGSIKLFPQTYKKFSCIPAQYNSFNGYEEFNYGITGGKYPTCAWSSDSYTNWLTQQSVNEKYDDIRQGINLMNMNIESYNATDMLMPAINNILNQSQARKMHELMPNQAKGNVNAGDIAYTTGALGFYYQKMSVRSEFAQKIDKFFSRFGYRVNDIKTPNLSSRTKFNYIKVGGSDELIHGDIPASDLEKINAIFRKGTTIFHDYSTFGNYTQTNTIVTP